MVLKKIRRRVALRVVCAYRTMSYEGASLLARLPPLHLLAKKYKELCSKKIECKNAGNRMLGRVYNRIGRMEHVKMLQNWKDELSGDRRVHNRIVGAILPFFELWIERPHGSLNYYLTQVVSGHGNFRDYLYKIKKSDTPNCLFCIDAIETAQHVIESCPAWEVNRLSIRELFDGDLSISGILRQMCLDENKWKAFSDYVTSILRMKDERERVILQQ